MVFWRKSTLLCKQEVRRSMVFSTVQISMPGTSWARTCPGDNVTDNKIAKQIEAFRLNMQVPHPGLITAMCAVRAQAAEDTILVPHSRVELGRFLGTEESQQTRRVGRSTRVLF